MTTKQTVLLTGAAGYIGSVVAERLLAAGYTVHGLTRSAGAGVSQLARRGMHPVQGTLDDTALLGAAIDQVDAVIHTATFGGPVPGTSLETQVTAAAHTLNVLLDKTSARGIPLISTSGAGVYGDTGTAQITEEVPVAAAGPFAAITAAESALLVAPHAHIVRPGVVYGRAGSAPVLAALEGVRRRGRAGFVHTDAALTVVHVDDLADLYLRVLQAKQAPPLLLAAGETLPSRQIMEALGTAAGVGETLDQLSAEEAAAAFGFIGHYLSSNMRLSGALARQAVDWTPHRPSILDDLRTGSYRYL